MVNLVAAITQYHADYGRYPAPKEATDALNNNCPDFTFGTRNTGSAIVIQNNNGIPANVETNNAQLIAILMNLETFPESGNPTCNKDFARNPRKNPYLNAKRVSGTTSSGVGDDLVYRDPWGNPYIVTIDFNYDDKCRDAFYRDANVTLNPSATNSDNGFNGLYRTPPNNGDEYEANVPAMVWSFGPDGKADQGTKANDDVNKDNILSWIK
jgi:hypothetical protein